MEEYKEPLMQHEDEMCEDMPLSEYRGQKGAFHRVALKTLKATQDLVVALGFIFIPSFALPSNRRALDRVSKTQFMNGLKGFAALVVYIGHFFTPLYPQLLDGYGQNQNSMLLQLPFIRIVYSGTAMVALFFVISGYVLSKTAIDHIQQGNYDQASKALAASIFKRAFRLYPAPIFSTFLVMLACRASLYDNPISPRLELKRPSHLATWREQILDWVSFVATFLFNPWQWFPKDPTSHYGGHLWTISISFTCSVFLFVGILGLSRLRRRAFIIVASFLVAYNLLVHREPLGLFYFGMLLAYTSSKVRFDLPNQHDHGHRYVFRYTLPTLVVVLGLYLASYPVNGCARAPGYLNSLIVLDPLSYFAIGAMAIVGGLLYQPFFQKPLCSSVPIYLGKISFSFYIVHEPLLQIFGWRVFLAVENASELKYQSEIIRYLALAVTWLLITASFVLIADFFWTHVEVPSTRFGNSLKARFFQSSNYMDETR